jgi:hypothetical protein
MFSSEREKGLFQWIEGRKNLAIPMLSLKNYSRRADELAIQYDRQG